MHKLSELIIFQALLAIVLFIYSIIISKSSKFVNEDDIFVTFIVNMLKNPERILYIKYYNIHLK